MLSAFAPNPTPVRLLFASAKPTSLPQPFVSCTAISHEPMAKNLPL